VSVTIDYQVSLNSPWTYLGSALFGTLTLVLIVAVAIYGRSQDVKPSEEMRAAKP
jgi:hypothetical protein